MWDNATENKIARENTEKISTPYIKSYRLYSSEFGKVNNNVLFHDVNRFFNF